MDFSPWSVQQPELNSMYNHLNRLLFLLAVKFFQLVLLLKELGGKKKKQPEEFFTYLGFLEASRRVRSLAGMTQQSSFRSVELC